MVDAQRRDLALLERLQDRLDGVVGSAARVDDHREAQLLRLGAAETTFDYSTAFTCHTFSFLFVRFGSFVLQRQ